VNVLIVLLANINKELKVSPALIVKMEPIPTWLVLSNVTSAYRVNFKMKRVKVPAKIAAMDSIKMSLLARRAKIVIRVVSLTIGVLCSVLSVRLVLMKIN